MRGRRDATDRPAEQEGKARSSGLSLTRRQFTRLMGVTALGVLAEACASPAAPPAAPPTSAPPAAAKPTTAASQPTTAPAASGQQPKRGGTLVYARNLDAKTLDPHFSAQFSERYALYLIFNTLVAYDKDFNIVPDLASSWDIGDGGKTITFHLRPNVKFHDGTDCDATAVKWNLDRVLDPAVNSPLKGQLQPPLEKVDVVDKTTVRLTSSMAWRPLLAALGERPGFIVSPTAVQKSGADFGRNPVGTGPFKFVEWTPDSRVVVERFDGYWDQGKPYLDRVEIRNVPDSQVRLGMVRTGEAHVIDSVDASVLPTLQGVSGVAVEELKSARFWESQFHNDKPPFDNANLRQAVAYATDREAVRQAAFRGQGRIATHPIGGGWAYDASLDKEGYPLDLDKAKQALAASGASGQKLTITISGQKPDQDIAQILQAGWQKAGLNVDIQQVPPSDAFAQIKDGRINWSVSNWAPRADPDGILRILWHSKGFQNTTGFNDPEVDRLLDEAAGIFDTAKAAELYHQAERRIVQDASYVFLVWPSEFAARRSNVGGFVYYPDLILRFRDLYFNA